MTTDVLTQEQVDRVASELAPDVVRIRLMVKEDTTGDPALYFRVVLSDEASEDDRLHEVTRRVRATLSEKLRLAEIERHPYFKFRALSEQAKMRDEAWE